MDATLSASLACDTIRAETAEFSTERVRRTGQVAILLAALRMGVVPRFMLELSGGERGVTVEELSRHILRPLVQRGFLRTSGDEVRISVAAARHEDAIGAWMDGETLDATDAKATPKKAKAIEVRVGDVFEYVDARGARHLVRCDERRHVNANTWSVGGHWMDASEPVRVYRAA